MKAQAHYLRWLIQAPISLVVIGLGVCLVADAALQKHQGLPWFWYGSLALVVLNSGVCLFGDSVLHRMRYERLYEKE
jgi:hypothetical protein